jgi:hypothetical protein
VNHPVASRAYSLLSEAGVEVLSAGDLMRALDVCRWTLRPIDVLLVFEDLANELAFQELRNAVASLQPHSRCLRLNADAASDRQRLVQTVRQAAAK